MVSRILVVDDSSLDRRFVGGILESKGSFQVAYSASVDEAMGHINGEMPPALIVTDLMMPKRDGLELVAAVGRKLPPVPVVLMTAKGSEQIAVRALQAGAASYVPKRQLEDLIVPTINRVLSMGQQELDTDRVLACMSRVEGDFAVGNDTSMVPPFLNYIHRSIRCMRLCDEADCMRVCIALEEALTNAIVHGNLEISSEERMACPDGFMQLMDTRKRNSPYAERSVRVRVQLTPKQGTFVVSDQGPGFDPSALPDPTNPDNLDKLSGRGLLLMNTFMDEVDFNRLGNQVTMVKRGHAALHS